MGKRWLERATELIWQASLLTFPARMSLMRHMKFLMVAVTIFCAMAETAVAAPLSSNARTVIPSAIQQIISVDYRDLRNSPSARALKDRVMPDTLKQFEQALRATGIDPERDAEQLTFVSYRGGKGTL